GPGPRCRRVFALGIAGRHQGDHQEAGLDILGGEPGQLRQHPVNCLYSRGDRDDVMAATEAPGAHSRGVRLSSLVYLEGSITPQTLLAPSASTATAADKALSMPPDK